RRRGRLPPDPPVPRGSPPHPLGARLLVTHTPPRHKGPSPMSSDNAPDTTLDTALLFDVVDLVGRTGSHRHVERTVPAPPREAGGVAMQVPEGQDIAV